MRSIPSETFCGQTIRQDQLNEIAMIVATFPKLTRTELANTICELFSWKRPTGKLKTVECRQFLERLDAKGIIQLPACQSKYAKRTKFSVDKTESSDIQAILSVKLRDLSPIRLSRVKNYTERQLWYEYMDRYHYLGYRLPFGAQLRYFINPEPTGIGWGVCSFRVRLGRWQQGIAGSAGAMKSESATCRKSLTTVGSSFFPGFGLKIWPARYLPWPSKQSRSIGANATAIARS
jgi:hypothetical protein